MKRKTNLTKKGQQVLSILLEMQQTLHMLICVQHWGNSVHKGTTVKLENTKMLKKLNVSSILFLVYDHIHWKGHRPNLAKKMRTFSLTLVSCDLTKIKLRVNYSVKIYNYIYKAHRRQTGLDTSWRAIWWSATDKIFQSHENS